jgi:exopolysaccharide biosynthesis WecB/TagA/CpsF family protein
MLRSAAVTDVVPPRQDAAVRAESDVAAPRCIRLLGLDFADVHAEAAAALLAARPAGAEFGYVVTPNADHLVRLARDPALAPLYAGALLRLLDSRVVAAAAAALRIPVPHVVPGSDLTQLLLTCHLHPAERVAIVGLRPAWLPALVARCGLAPPLHYNPPMGFAADPQAMAAAVAFVLAHPARFVFLAVGSPQQEVLAAAIAATGRATGTGLCIGCSLEFLAGVTRRAPAWMQRTGLEWLFRLAGHPYRLGHRYVLDSPAVFRLLLRERMGGSLRLPPWPGLIRRSTPDRACASGRVRPGLDGKGAGGRAAGRGDAGGGDAGGGDPGGGDPGGGDPGGGGEAESRPD